MARNLENNGKDAKLKEKQKWSFEKLHLENARKLRGIYFIDPKDTEFKETIKNARKKLETSIAPAMPCKIMKKNCGSGASNKIKTRLACILEASESTRLRMGESLPNYHEDHVAGKGDNSLQHYNLVHNPKSFSLTIPYNLANIVKFFLGIIFRLHHTDRKLMGLLREQCAEDQERDLCCIVAIRSGWKLVGRFYGMLHLSAKRHWFIIWWEDTIWKSVRNAIWRTSYSVWSNGRMSPCLCKRPI